MTARRHTTARWVALLATSTVASCSSGEPSPPARRSVVVLELAPSCGDAGGCDVDLSCLGAVSLRAWASGGDVRARCLRGADLASVERGCDLGSLDVELALGDVDGPLSVDLVGYAAPDCAGPDVLFEGAASGASPGGEIAVTLECGATCEDVPAEIPVVLSFGGSCGGDDGSDLDLSCLGAVSFRVWTPAWGLWERCLVGDDLAGLASGADLGTLGLGVAGVETGPLAVELVGFSGTSCAPSEDAPARVLFDAVEPVVAPGAEIALRLHCTAGCGEGTDPCDGADSCDCCAGVCVDADAMLHCGACFDPCDPFRADRCGDGVCRCGAGPACGADEVCCADGTCAVIGQCAATPCPFGSGGDCADPSDDEDACGGGIGVDACAPERSDACTAGGCTCGGEPACGGTFGYCWDGDCVD